MFYTKLVISESSELLLEQSFVAVLSARWGFVSVTTTGGSKAKRYTPTSEWVPSANFENYNSAESEAENGDLSASGNLFPAGTTYYEEVRGWESAAIAQQFVAAVQALNLSGVTVSYEDTTDPTAV
jgi:hypothetical protein